MTDQQVQQLLDRQLDKFYGKYRGLVTDNQDPTKRGRVQAVVPEVLGTEHTTWAEPCTPYGGTTSGFYAIPPLGAGVWIEFEAGDISRPIWVGGYWSSVEAPTQPPAPAPPVPTQHIWRSTLGLTVAMNDALQTIALTDALGQNQVKVDVKTGTVTIAGLARVVLDAPLVQEGSGTAFHPGVLGDKLLAYLGQIVTAFNTHVHPGELALGFMPVTPAPPVTPMPPPTSALVSTTVFLE